MKYKYIGAEERFFPTLGITIQPGETFESDVELNSPFVKLIPEENKGDGKE